MTPPATPVRLAVATTCRAGRDRARDVATILAVPDAGDVAAIDSAAWDLVVTVTEHGLELRDGPQPRRRGLRVDFRTLDRSPRGCSPRQPLGRAVGPLPRQVVDATAGFGTDAMRLAIMGFEVVAIERVTVARLLLEDGLSRAADVLPEAVGRVTVVAGDARTVLARGDLTPEAIYLDPMYPPKRKASALAPKPVRLLGQLAGDDADAATLLDVARHHATDRVVVKRPHHAAPLAAAIAPDWTVESKLVRYDCYRPRRPALPPPAASPA